MFAKILTPIQNELSDRKVFDQALALARQNQSRLLLLHIISASPKSSLALPTPSLYQYPVITDELMKDYRRRWETMENQGLDMLKALAQEAEDRGVQTEFSQNVGGISQTICTMIKNWQADLVVIRQPDRSKLDELFLGSISNYVLHHSVCPVLTVPA